MTRATHNFIFGLGGVLDLMPDRTPSRVGEGIDLNRSDAEALHRDWERLAQDFRAAFDDTAKEFDDHVPSKQAK